MARGATAAEFSPQCGENAWCAARGSAAAGFPVTWSVAGAARRPPIPTIPDKMNELISVSLLTDVRRMIDPARARAAAAVNAELTLHQSIAAARARLDDKREPRS